MTTSIPSERELRNWLFFYLIANRREAIDISRSGQYMAYLSVVFFRIRELGLVIPEESNDILYNMVQYPFNKSCGNKSADEMNSAIDVLLEWGKLCERNPIIDLWDIETRKERLEALVERARTKDDASTTRRM